ncbi:hypothetical protein [Stieleria marina]|uniref:Uncharacterized protein n=1 Tax=Stieleria marina TaxID=1930275 RepID=A0A517NP74_9BACT|nr:hypothetical protein K239x_08740 [Planctomycetes bacterium K23_9]
MFFKPKPNLSDGEKARIEFHLQTIAEAIGAERLTLPVLDREAFLSKSTPQEIIQLAGEHLSYDVNAIQVTPVLQQAGQCGGGG